MKALGILFLLSFPFINFSQINKNTFEHLNNKYEVITYRDGNHDVVVNVSNLEAKKVDQITISKNETEHSFINTLTPIFKKVSGNYTFQLPSDIQISLSVDSLSYSCFLREFQRMHVDSIGKFLKHDSLLAKKNKELLGFFKNKNITINGLTLFLEGDSLKIKDSEGSIYYHKDTLTKLLIGEIKEDTNLIKELLTQSDFTSIVTEKFDFTENQKKQLSLLYKKSFGNDDFEFIGNYKAKNNDKVSVYEASVRQNSKEEYFELRFCKNSTNNCRHSIKLDLAINREFFYKEVKSLINAFDDTISDSYILEALYQKCVTYNQEKLISYKTEPYQRTKDSLLDAIDNQKTRYSGILKLNSEIPISVSENSKMCKGIKKRRFFNLRKYKYKSDKCFEQSKKRTFPFLGKYKYKSKKDHSLCKRSTVSHFVFKPKYATVRFFNNRVKKVVLVGDVVNKKTNEREEFISINFNYSVPMRTLNDDTRETNGISCKLVKNGRINYSDVFMYYPYEHTHNYSVKNKEYRVNINDSVKVEERKLADYITPVIFSDFLGLNSNNSNGLVQAEAVALIPLWIKNRKYVSFFSSIRADFNASLYNGFDDDSRFINEQGFLPFDSNKVTINPFDFVKFANVNTGISLNVFSLELKGLSSTLNFGYGIRYFRSGFKYTQIDTSRQSPDIITRDQLNSLSNEYLINLQIRPQANFGADLNFSYNYIHPAGAKNNAIIDNFVEDHGQRKFIRFSLDLYSKINPDVSQGGVYARLGGFFHLADGSQEFYPQIMVGYATNLSSFVNRFTRD